MPAPLLVLEDPTWPRATKPLNHNYWSLCAQSCAPQQEKQPQRENLTLQIESGPRLPQQKKAQVQQQRRSTAKNN